MSAKSEWKVVRDRAREAENAPLPEKLVAVAALKELQTRPPRPRVSGPEYQAAEKRQVRSFGRRRRALEAWRAAVRERRAAVRNFAAGVAQAFPRGFRRVDRLARVALAYFDRLAALRPGQPLPPVPFDQRGLWCRPLPPPRGVVKSVVSDALTWRLWRAPRMRERAAALGRAPERPPERAPEPPKVEAARPRPKPMTLGM